MSSIESRQGSSVPGQRPRWPLFALLALSLMLGVTVAVRALDPNAFNWDVGWILYAAEQALGDDRLYVDLIDENPPLVFWLSMPPVALARLVGLQPIVVFDFMVLALAFVAAALVHHVLSRAWPASPPSRRHALVAMVVCLGVLAPGLEYGQRENLLLVAFVPYVFVAAARASGHPISPAVALAAGLLGGLGVAIKPFFGALWAGAEIAALSTGRVRWVRPENVSVVVVNLVFLASIAVFVPEYVELLATNLKVVSGYREGYLASIRVVSVVVVALALLAHLAFRAEASERGARRVLVGACIGALVSALAQGADYAYRYHPAEATGILLLCAIALGGASGKSPLAPLLGSWATRVPAIVFAALFVWAGATLAGHARSVFAPTRRDETAVRILARVAAEHARGQPIWVISTSVNPGFPVVNLAETGWASRHSCVSLLGHLYTPEERARTPFPYHPIDALPDAEQQLFDEVVADLRASPPALIVVDASDDKQTLGKTSFRFLEYFRRDPRFAEIFRGYEYMARVGTYRIFKRRGV